MRLNNKWSEERERKREKGNESESRESGNLWLNNVWMPVHIQHLTLYEVYVLVTNNMSNSQH